MHSVIHGHEPATTGNLVFVGIPGVHQHGNVMIPVQEDQPLLTQDDEYGVPWKSEGVCKKG